MTHSERIKEIRKAKNLTQGELASACEVSQAVIGNVENGNREISKTLMKALVEKFNVSANWLLTGEGEMFGETQRTESQTAAEPGGPVPFYDIDVMAHIADSLDFSEERPAAMLSIPGFGDCFACFPVYGNSMEPKISSGDIIAVSQPVPVDRVLWGEIYLVITDCWRVVKTVHPGVTEEYIVLRSINPEYAGDVPVKKDDVRALYLVRGVVSRLGM